MKKQLKFAMTLVLISFFTAIMIPPNLAQAKKAIEINFSWANPQYPEFAEAFGLNMYLAALEGITLQHPALKGKVKMKIYDKGMLYGNQDEALTALSSGAIQMTYSGPHFLEQLSPEWRLGEAPGMEGPPREDGQGTRCDHRQVALQCGRLVYLLPQGAGEKPGRF